MPIPATAEMAAADPNRRGWVEAWLRSFGGTIADHAEGIAETMQEAGYSSRRSLAGLFHETPAATAKLFKIKKGEAFDVWSQAATMHGQCDEAAAAARHPWTGFTKTLEDGAGAAALSVPSLDQVDLYFGHVWRHAKARDAAQTQHLAAFLGDAYM